MKTYFERKDWLVEKDDDGSVRAVGPNGTAMYVDDDGIWIDHEVPSAEYEDALVLERVAMPMDWFVAVLRANGFEVVPPTSPEWCEDGIQGWAGDEAVSKTAWQRITDAGSYLTEVAANAECGQEPYHDKTTTETK